MRKENSSFQLFTFVLKGHAKVLQPLDLLQNKASLLHRVLYLKRLTIKKNPVFYFCVFSSVVIRKTSGLWTANKTVNKMPLNEPGSLGNGGIVNKIESLCEKIKRFQVHWNSTSSTNKKKTNKK